jgi:tRNA (mo5U34)-methyltransferase
MSPDELRQAVAGIKWYHQIDLGDGIVTSGESDTFRALPRLRFPDSFRGMTVLDIGAWDGFYSFEAERRGADRVLATDHFCWSGEGWGTKAGFDLAHRVFNSRVEAMDIDVLDLSPQTVGAFFVVLFTGVLYHMRHPLLALERVASVTRRWLILETAVDMLWRRRPALAFYPDAELNHDPTNWFAPNHAALRGMLETVGFRRVEIVFQQSLLHRLGRAAKQRLAGRSGFFRALGQGRTVVHAWR